MNDIKTKVEKLPFGLRDIEKISSKISNTMLLILVINTLLRFKC